MHTRRLPHTTLPSTLFTLTTTRLRNTLSQQQLRLISNFKTLKQDNFAYLLPNPCDGKRVDVERSAPRTQSRMHARSRTKWSGEKTEGLREDHSHALKVTKQLLLSYSLTQQLNLSPARKDSRSLPMTKST